MSSSSAHTAVTRVLVVEKDKADTDAILAAFTEYGPAFDIEVVDSLTAAREAIHRESPHLVIAAATLDDGAGAELLPAKHSRREFPLIVTSNEESSRSAVEAMRAGAVDFIVTTGYSLSNLPLIASKTVSDWQRTLTELHLQEFNERAARILEYLPDFVGVADSDGRIMFINRVGRAMLGARSNEDVTGEHMHSLFPDWEVGDFIYPDASRTDIEMKWNANARMKTCTGDEVSAIHAVFAYVSPTSEVEYFTIVARGEREHSKGRG